MSTLIMSACPLCGDEGDVARAAMQEYERLVPGAGICGACATRVANAYSMRHSGEWLTWTNAAPAVTRSRKVVIGLALRTAVFERDEYRCLRCGTHLSLRADHVVPEAEGGPATLENLQTLCSPCNSWKGTKTLDFRRPA